MDLNLKHKNYKTPGKGTGDVLGDLRFGNEL